MSTTGERMSKSWHVYTTENYSEMKGSKGPNTRKLGGSHESGKDLKENTLYDSIFF